VVNLNVSDLFVALWGMLGGVSRALDNVLRVGVVPGVPRLIGHLVIACFCGFVAHRLAVKLDPELGVAAASIGGWLGPEVIDLWVRAKTGK